MLGKHILGPGIVLHGHYEAVGDVAAHHPVPPYRFVSHPVCVCVRGALLGSSAALVGLANVPQKRTISDYYYFDYVHITASGTWGPVLIFSNYGNPMLWGEVSGK